MTFIDKLLHHNKKFILSSIYQNTTYNGQPLYEYFGVEKKSNKEGKSFDELLTLMISNIVPTINPSKIMCVLDELGTFGDYYVRYGHRYIKINDLMVYIRELDDTLVLVSPTTFFCRKHNVRGWDKNGTLLYINYIGTTESKRDKRIKLYNDSFKHITSDNINELFQDSDIDTYKKLGELI